jgi:hypothetical protein
MTMTFHLQLGAAENIARRDVVAIRECLGLLQLNATTRRRRHGDDVRIRSFARPQVGIDSVSGIRFRRRREFIGGCRAVVPHVQPVSARNLHRGLPHLQQVWAPLAHICPKTGLPLPTSAPRLGYPCPHLQQDWAPLAHICPKTGLPLPTSAPRLGSPCPHLPQDWRSLVVFVGVIVPCLCVSSSLCLSVCLRVSLCASVYVGVCGRAFVLVTACVRAFIKHQLPGP